MLATQQTPLRRWFGTPTAVHTSLLSPEARAKVGSAEYVERHELRDLLSGSDWRGEWTLAVARGKEIEAVVIGERATSIAESMAPKVGGKLMRRVIDTTNRATDSVAAKLGLNKSAGDLGKSAIGAGLTTPLTKTGVLGDVAFSTATNVAEALLRSGTTTDTADHVDTATSITYDVATGTAAGVVGTFVGVFATPPVGIAAAVATKLGIDAVRDPIVWGVASLIAGAKAAFSGTKSPEA